MTRETIDKLETAFSYDCTDEEACFFAGIGKDALYEYQKKHPEFTERKEALKQNPVLLARESVVKNLRLDPKLAMQYLERKKKSEFALRSEFTGANGQPLPAIKVTILPDPIDEDESSST